MSHQNDTISEYHCDGLNTNVGNDDNDMATTITTAIATNIINDYNINDDNSDRCDSNDCDKPDYLNIDCDRNLNIHIVGMDFEVNKFHVLYLSLSLSLSPSFCLSSLHTPSAAAAASGTIFFLDKVRLFPFAMGGRWDCG